MMSVDTSNCGRNKIIEVVVSTNQGNGSLVHKYWNDLNTSMHEFKYC
jgi:hypothetical protein